jgi:hypothetical protein
VRAAVQSAPVSCVRRPVRVNISSTARTTVYRNGKRVCGDSRCVEALKERGSEAHLGDVVRPGRMRTPTRTRHRGVTPRTET